MKTSSEVLIVDDEPNVRLVFRTALESVGYVVSEASDGEVALEQIRGRNFEVVLLDLRMPQVGGLDLLGRLRNEGIEVPVVIVTAHGSMPDVVSAIRLGAVDFIPKPLSLETLRRVVREAVDLGRSSKDQPQARQIREETLSRARRAVQRGDLDEADFFLHLATPLGADSVAVSRLASEVMQLRERTGLRPYRMSGGLIWG
jgi:DNA-binding NtrC family response regulator